DIWRRNDPAHRRAMRVHFRFTGCDHFHRIGQVFDGLEQSPEIPPGASPAKYVALLGGSQFADVLEPIDLERNIAEPGCRHTEQALEVAAIAKVYEQAIDIA